METEANGRFGTSTSDNVSGVKRRVRQGAVALGHVHGRLQEAAHPVRVGILLHTGGAQSHLAARTHARTHASMGQDTP